jgi:hypothetical protein
MRPTYEQESDRNNEHYVAALYCKKGYTFEMTPKFFDFDVAYLENDIIKAIAEIKCRTHKYGDFPTFFISAEKLRKLHALHISTGLPTLIIVSWSCGTVGHVMIPVDVTVTIGGRTDRNDAKDIEMLVHIPINKFTLKKQ